MTPTLICPGPLSRRHFLKIGALALGGLTVNGLSALRVQAKEGPSLPDTSVIFIWLPGGPPHMETYDMKPDAPAEYRGDFRPIRTNVPGIDVCEQLPLHARSPTSSRLIRSIAHTFADHGGGHKRFLTGRDPLQPTGFVNDYPMVGSMVAKVRENRKVRRAELHRRHRRRPRRHRRVQLRLGVSRHRRRIRSWSSGDPSAPKFRGAEPRRSPTRCTNA